jgi:hypothetical protein
VTRACFLEENSRGKGISCEFIDMGVFKKKIFRICKPMAKGVCSLKQSAYHIIEIADKSESISLLQK